MRVYRHMACVFIQGVKVGQGGLVVPAQSEIEISVVLAAINTSLFLDKLSSDVHAEANAVAEAARCGLPLRETSVYVTMPPCKNCYKLLAAAGVRRVVSRRALCSPEALRHMTQEGIEFVQLEETAEHLAALDACCQPHVDRAAVELDRLRRKQVRAANKERSRLKRSRQEEDDLEAGGDTS